MSYLELNISTQSLVCRRVGPVSFDVMLLRLDSKVFVDCAFPGATISLVCCSALKALRNCFHIFTIIYEFGLPVTSVAIA